MRPVTSARAAPGRDATRFTAIATGAEAYYRYARGDSMITLLPNARRTRLVELEVRPRQPHWRLVVGSLWFDEGNAQLVRAVYRMAVPLNIWEIVEEEEPDEEGEEGEGELLLVPVEAGGRTVQAVILNDLTAERRARAAKHRRAAS